MLSIMGQSVGFVEDLLSAAVLRRASDVHIEPLKDRSRIRLRIDGMLQLLCELDRSDHDGVISRIKVINGMDITEKRLPQDGHMEKEMDGKLVDLRVSTMPVTYGEKMVIRILDKSNACLDLDRLSFTGDNLAAYRNLFASPHGIVLVTGPTGSGKSTTLYATINELNRPQTNIITIEDPVEYQIPGVNQVTLNAKAGLHFANGLRSIVRQDPDIIMVGEIRDEETARIAVQAALTGHLVLSTLHTNDAVGAITRLLDMGIESYLLASCLRGVVAQRLVRKVCRQCGEEYAAGAAELACLRLPAGENRRLVKNAGCADCFGTGYNGRLTIQEVLTVDDEMRNMISQGSSEKDLLAHARNKGFRSLYEDGVDKVLAGVTTLSELHRAVGAGQ